MLHSEYLFILALISVKVNTQTTDRIGYAVGLQYKLDKEKGIQRGK